MKSGYKHTEVGVIPEDWEWQPLGLLGEFKNGINKPKKDFGFGFPFVNLLDVFGRNVINDSGSGFGLINSSEGERFVYNLIDGDVLFVRSSVKPEGVGLAILVDGELFNTVYSGFLIRFRSNCKIDKLFKRYCFNDGYFRKDLISRSTISANTNINQNSIKRIVLRFPSSLPEQRAIAEALSDVDAVLAEQDRLIAKKRDMKHAVMQELLTGKTRLPGFSEPWEVKRLGDHLVFLRNGVNSRAELQVEGNVRYLHYGDIHASNSSSMSPVGLPFLPDYKASRLDRLNEGDLVFADASEDIDGVCKSVEIVKINGCDVVSGLHTIAVRFSRDIFSNGFKRFLQYIPEFYTKIRRLAAGTKVFATSRSHIASVEMSVPPKDEQTAIAEVLSDLDAEIDALESLREKTRLVKQGMMQELLTGQIRLVP